MTDADDMVDTDNVETAQHRRERLILGALLHSPGSFEAALRAGLSAEIIADKSLRDVLRLIARGPIATVAVLRGSNITSAGTDAARRLYAETIPLNPASLFGLIRDLVAVAANDDEYEHIEVDKTNEVAGIPAT
jgi:hypothetical protein